MLTVKETLEECRQHGHVRICKMQKGYKADIIIKGDNCILNLSNIDYSFGGAIYALHKTIQHNIDSIDMILSTIDKPEPDIY